MGYISREKLGWWMFENDKIYFVFRDNKGVFIRSDDKQKWYDYELGINLENLVEE